MIQRSGSPDVELNSAANAAHGALRLDEGGLADVVPVFLCEDNLLQRASDLCVGRASAERRFKVMLVQAEQAGANFAIGSES